jgi:hypothetical protein
MTISRATLDYLLDQVEEDVRFGGVERRHKAVQAKKELSAYLAQLNHAPIRFQFFKHPVYPCEIWTFGDVPAEVDTPSQIALGLHVLAFAASCPRRHVPLRVLDPTITAGEVYRVRVAVSKARDFIGWSGGSADLATALSRVTIHGDSVSASFWPKPDDAPLLLSPP